MPGIIQGMVYEITLEGLQGALTGATVHLMQGANVVAQQITNKGQYAFTDVVPGTYSLIFKKVDPQTGVQTHQTVTLTGIIIDAGQTLTAETVFMQEVQQGRFVIENLGLIGNITALSKNLGTVSGLEKGEAVLAVFETLVPRKTARIEVVEEITGSDIVKDKAAMDRVSDLVKGKIINEGVSGEDIAREYKETTNLLIEKYKTASGEEKKTYKTLINTVAIAMLDNVATSELNELSAGTEDILKETVANLKNANISIKTLKNNWKGNDLKNKLKISSVTRVNKIFK
ncbi:MAG: hypothetical protein B6I19_11070 [Bacteroidetes bacterium 4572_114]|nr:MAG: hypothetical protein B6I19_11070 [Bacteroidetes bacterium 4572_114]